MPRISHEYHRRSERRGSAGRGLVDRRPAYSCASIMGGTRVGGVCGPGDVWRYGCQSLADARAERTAARGDGVGENVPFMG